MARHTCAAAAQATSLMRVVGGTGKHTVFIEGLATKLELALQNKMDCRMTKGL